MRQSPRLAFTSLAFPIESGEDDATNPGIFGKALAHWLATELQERGIPAGEVIPEDFGWCLRIGARSDRLYVACASDPERRGRWRVFVFQDGSLLANLFGRGAAPDPVTDLFVTLQALLEAAPEAQDLSIEAE